MLAGDNWLDWVQRSPHEVQVDLHKRYVARYYDRIEEKKSELDSRRDFFTAQLAASNVGLYGADREHVSKQLVDVAHSLAVATENQRCEHFRQMARLRSVYDDARSPGAKSCGTCWHFANQFVGNECMMVVCGTAEHNVCDMHVQSVDYNVK